LIYGGLRHSVWLKKYRPDRSGKDDRPYPKPQKLNTFLASEMVIFKQWTENKNYIMEIV